MNAEGLVQIAGFAIAAADSVSTYEPYLVESVCSHGILDPSDSNNPSSSYPLGFPNLFLMFDGGSLLYLLSSVAGVNLSDE